MIGTLVLIAASFSAYAQYPNKPVLIVAPFSAGGDSDLAARNLSAVLPKYTGQNSVVLNRVGASGAIGSEYVKKAAPDGYTLLLARVGSQATLPALKPDLSYKWNDFTFLGLLELNPYVCAVRGDSPYKTFSDLVEGIRKNPGRLKYSTAGVGTIHEMGPQMLFDILKLGKEAAIQVPYKGGGEASVALVSGHVDINCTNIGTALGFILSGQLRALLTTTPERYKEIPNVPTAREAGYPQLERIIGWSALYGPPGMDRKLVGYWGEVLQKVAKDPQWVNATEKMGSVPRIMNPADTSKFVKEQFETYDRLGKAIGLVLQ
jgi:tripartite-type tricarboxylate transporter receptor subunit TctC